MPCSVLQLVHFGLHHRNHSFGPDIVLPDAIRGCLNPMRDVVVPAFMPSRDVVHAQLYRHYHASHNISSVAGNHTDHDAGRKRKVLFYFNGSIR